MKKLAFILLLLIGVAAMAQNSYPVLISKAYSLYIKKAYKESADTYAAAFRIEKKNADDLYNAACSYALAGEPLPAISLLNQILDRGWANFNHLKSDADLASLHGTYDWTKLMTKTALISARLEANYNQPVKKELEKIYSSDQGIRDEYVNAQKKYVTKHRVTDSLAKIMMHYDSINIVKVTKILDRYGWLGEDKVGARGNVTLFLVIQHADLAVQQKYLPMMRKAMKAGKASAGSLALLEDRVALGEGRKQLYGSQLAMKKDGSFYLLPLQDPDHVDLRRAKVGLGPIADYVKRWKIVWDLEAYKKELPELEKLNKL